MRSSRALKALSGFLLLALLAACGGGGSSSTSSSSNSNLGAPAAPPNVLNITVNGSLCSSSTSASYANKPCVSVTICTPGTSDCQTVNDVLLDTGSFGLRIFQSALTVPVTPITNSSGGLAECVEYADNSSDWGPVGIADVILGNEPAVQVPVQIINSGFANSSSCGGKLDTDPKEAGFTAILGVGTYAQDCGSGCVTDPEWGGYFICNGSGPDAACTSTTVPLSNQVTNPVALLPQDNNGVLVELPALSGGSSPSADGSLVLGIGTQSNNSPPAGTSVYFINNDPNDAAYTNISTAFNSKSYYGFLDTGSNGLFFSPSPSILNTCSGNPGWFCPPDVKSFSATNSGIANSSAPLASTFSIGDFDTLITSSNLVSAEIGGRFHFGYFDWGLPFFFGQNIYVGIEGTSSGLGTGPYWAY